MTTVAEYWAKRADDSVEMVLFPPNAPFLVLRHGMFQEHPFELADEQSTWPIAPDADIETAIAEWKERQ